RVSGEVCEVSQVRAPGDQARDVDPGVTAPLPPLQPPEASLHPDGAAGPTAPGPAVADGGDGTGRHPPRDETGHRGTGVLASAPHGSYETSQALGRGRSRFEQAQRMRLARGLRPRAAVELREDVANVHVDRPRAEKELARDLAVRPPDGHEPEDFELPPRQARAVKLPRGSAAESALDALAERLELLGGLGTDA